METEGTDQVKIKEEVNDQEEMDSDNFVVKEEMVFVDMKLKEETEDPEADSVNKSSSEPFTVIAPGEIPFNEDLADPNNLNSSRERNVGNSSSENEDILRSTLAEGRPTRTINAPKQYSPSAYKSGPASRRKRKDDSECEPSTTSTKKRTIAVSGSSNRSDHFETATSSKQIHEVDNDIDSDNGDDQDDVDDDEEELEDDDMEDPENSSYPSLDDSNADLLEQSALKGAKPKKRSKRKKASTKNNAECEILHVIESLESDPECLVPHKVNDSPEKFRLPGENISRTTGNIEGEHYRPRTRNIPPYKDTNSTHSDERICHRKYSRETLRAALEAVKSRRLSMRKASKEFGVPYSTISRLKTEDNPFKRRGRATLLTGEEEEELIRWIKERSELGFRVTPSILRQHVQSVMNEKPGAEGGPVKSTPPSRKWFTNFLARHPEIAIRKPVTATPGKRGPAHIMTQDEEDEGAYPGGRYGPDGAMYGEPLYGEGADGGHRAYFDGRAGPNKPLCLRDDSDCSVWLSVENFRCVVGEELMEQLECVSDVENCSKEFRALHRLWKMFPALPPGKDSPVAADEVMEQTLQPFT